MFSPGSDASKQLSDSITFGSSEITVSSGTVVFLYTAAFARDRSRIIICFKCSLWRCLLQYIATKNATTGMMKTSQNNKIYRFLLVSDWTVTQKSGVMPDCFILYVGNVKIIVKSVQLPRYGGAVEGLTVEGCSVIVVGSRLTTYSFSEVTAAVVVEGSDTDEEIWSASVVVERADTEDIIL